MKYGWRAEGYEDLGELYTKTRTEGFGTEVKRRILLGTFVLSSGYYDAYYKKALQAKAVIKGAFDQAFTKYDLLLTPVAPTTAPKLGESLQRPAEDVPQRHLHRVGESGGPARPVHALRL